MHIRTTWLTPTTWLLRCAICRTETAPYDPYKTHCKTVEQLAAVSCAFWRDTGSRLVPVNVGPVIAETAGQGKAKDLAAPVADQNGEDGARADQASPVRPCSYYELRALRFGFESIASKMIIGK
jgi:hypothetical protein